MLQLNAPRKRTYADALTGKGTRTGPCQGPKGRVRKSKRAKKRAAAKAPLKVAGNCPASVKCKKVGATGMCSGGKYVVWCRSEGQCAPVVICCLGC